jgi:hypothetical protein
MNARGRVREPGMNKTEARYGQELELRKRVGEILWYCFEGMKFRLADNTFYTPDFAVLTADGMLQCHEIKGTEMVRSNNGIHYARARAEDDAKVKVKVAAEMYPITFFVAHFTREGGWTLTEM